MSVCMRCVCRYAVFLPELKGKGEGGGAKDWRDNHI